MIDRVRLVIFDLDGTLIDTMGGFADIAGDLLRQYYGWSFEHGRKRYLETSGVPFFQQLEVLMPRQEKNKEIDELFERRKISSFVKESISPKTVETLHQLKDREMLTAISSNNFDSLVREFVRRENVPIDSALGYRTDFAKGFQHFDYLRHYFSIPFDQMVFIGDSLSDARKARESSIQFIPKIGTFNESDFAEESQSHHQTTVYEIHEVLDLLEVP